MDDLLAAAEREYYAGATAAAERILSQAISEFPSSARAYFLLGLTARRAGNSEAALQHFRTAVGLDGSEPDYHYHVGATFQDLCRHDAAVSAFQQSIAGRPDFAQAHNSLGVSLAQIGRHPEAQRSFETALRLQPDYAEARNNLALSLSDEGKLDEACVAFREALRQRPNYPAAHNNLGITLARLGRLNEAIASYREALRLTPEYVEALNNLGNSLARLDDLQSARQAYETALRIRPDYPECHNNLGIVLGRQGNRDAAIEHYQRALRLKPQYPEAVNNLGTALSEAGKVQEALTLYDRALSMNPHYAEAWNNRGNALREVGQFDESARNFAEALKHKPDYPEAHNNRGLTLEQLGEYEEGLAEFNEAVRLRPDYADAHMNRALAWLARGKFADGWREYEWRWRCRDSAARDLLAPRWDGGPVQGGTILLWTEQGLGDALQFVRYASHVKRISGAMTVLLEVQPALMELLTGVAGIDQIIPRGAALPAFDVHSPLLSLPRLCGSNSVNDIPASVPYLRADPLRVVQWQTVLRSQGPAFRVGIGWQGNPRYRSDRWRSASLAAFAPLARIPGIQLFALQKGVGRDQVDHSRDQVNLVDLGPRLDEGGSAFVDTAAVLTGLDLVITTDTALAHLAGALGRSVWVVLSAISDWRWMRQRDDSPWYPTMRLFRQQSLADWNEVFCRVAEELSALAKSPRPMRSVYAEISAGEFFDKRSILEIKSDRIQDPAALEHINTELERLNAALDHDILATPALQQLVDDLKGVNERLWQIEDEIRICERSQEFGDRFIDIARSVYRTNDRRSAIKRRINDLVKSTLVEEKAYAPYEGH